MAASGSNTTACKGKKNVTCRRSWTRTEEDMLVNALKEIVSTGWKSDNGFRVGYLNVLQDKLQKVFPTTDLRANPHISSKMHAWKRQYNSLFLVFGHTGVGWNHTTKMIETDSDEHWEPACKTEPNARCIRNKSWPYYDSWCEIFGKDRANGYGAEDFQDALNGVLNMQNEADDNQEINLEDIDIPYTPMDEEVATTPAVEVASSTTTKPTKPSKKGKRKLDDTVIGPIIESIENYSEKTDARLAQLVGKMGHEQEMTRKCETIWSIVDEIDDLNLEDKLVATNLIVKNPQVLAMFLSLPPLQKLGKFV